MRRKPRQDGEGIYEPNMTPLIDVSLVLVVILLVATPMALQSSIMVQKTGDAAHAAAATTRTERIEVTVVSSDSVIVNRRALASADLPATVVPLLQASATRTVAVRCWPQVKHGTFVAVVDELQELGAAHIAVQGR